MKVIAIIEKPIDCQRCWFSRCHYSLPLSTNRKGYSCQLLKGARIVEDFDYDEKVHLRNCPLREVPQKKERDFSSLAELHEIIGYNACIDEILGGGE